MIACEFLLQNAADVNQRDHRGRGPLHHATYLGHTGWGHWICCLTLLKIKVLYLHLWFHKEPSVEHFHKRCFIVEKRSLDDSNVIIILLIYTIVLNIHALWYLHGTFTHFKEWNDTWPKNGIAMIRCPIKLIISKTFLQMYLLYLLLFSFQSSVFVPETRSDPERRWWGWTRPTEHSSSSC